MIMRRIIAIGMWLAISATPAAACPNPDLGALRQISTNGASLRLGLGRRVTAGGTGTLEECGHLGLRDVPQMQFNAAPSLVANLSGMMGLAMEIQSQGQCPTGLLVRTADGAWYYDDRGRGAGLPRLMLRRPGRGEFKVWVGTPTGDLCRTQVRLTTYPG